MGWYECEFPGPLYSSEGKNTTSFAPPNACVVCHGDAAVTFHLKKSGTGQNGSIQTTTKVDLPLRLCERCSKRANTCRGFAAFVAIAAALTGLVIVYGVLKALGASGGAMLFGIWMGGLMAAAGLGVGGYYLVYATWDNVRKAVTIAVAPDASTYRVRFRDKAMAIAFARLNRDVVALGLESEPLVSRVFGIDSRVLHQQWEDRLTEWSSDAEAVARAESLLGRRQADKQQEDAT